MTAIVLGADRLAELVTPIIPLAGRDDYMPVINAVLIESDGKWLSASATDRFRIGIKRIEKYATDDDPATEWPQFRALVPLRSIKAILAMHKPRRGALPPDLTLTVADNSLTVEAVGAFDLFDSARFTYTLQAGDFPAVRSLIRDALAKPADERATDFGINPDFMADFKAVGRTLRVVTGPTRANGDKGPLILTDNNGFIGVLTPRRIVEASEDWTDFLAEKPEPKKAPARKRTAKKASAA